MKTKGEQMNAKNQADWIKWFNCGGHGCATVWHSKDTRTSMPHSGPGWYVHCSEYPDEGSQFLGKRLLVKVGPRGGTRALR